MWLLTKISNIFCIVFASFICSVTVFQVSADELAHLDNKAKAEQITENAHNQKRVVLSAEQRTQLTVQRDRLAKQLAQIEQENTTLSETFALNEQVLADKEKELQLATGSLGELFGVVRQAAKDAQLDYQNSLLGEEGEALSKQLEKVINTDALPSLTLLTYLWQAMDYKAKASSELALTSVPFVEGDGKITQLSVMRIGDIALLSEQGYVQWNFTRQQAYQYLALPSTIPSLSDLQADPTQAIVIDPTRGAMLAQYAHQPTLMQRVDQAGVVGKIILAILVIGLVIVAVRGVRLAMIQQQITKQLKQPEMPTDNPLGRILSVYNKEKKQSIESLELRLLESILDEQQGLERGLSMLKLFAALAPMLGLLGTVTGMIETFQVITQFGNSDPKVMAGGISMALTTTVLGLVAAMPLLLAHNILSNRAEVIRNTLEKQGVSLVAKRSEIEWDASTEVDAC